MQVQVLLYQAQVAPQHAAQLEASAAEQAVGCVCYWAGIAHSLSAQQRQTPLVLTCHHWLTLKQPWGESSSCWLEVERFGCMLLSLKVVTQGSDHCCRLH